MAGMNEVADVGDLDGVVIALRGLGVSTVYEAAGQQGLVDVPLIQLVPGSRAAGPARTVLCGQDDNLMVHAVMAEARPGEILVLTMPEPRPVALVGELLATQAQARGVAGLLVDAAVRDVEELQRLGLPIWSRFVRAGSTSKKARGAIGVPVTVGGARIEQGDVVVMDADGAVVVQAARLIGVAAASEQRAERETALREQLRAGQLTYDLHDFRRLVEG
jgi:4-hydroxy-4-methyl-2-oxoglutarate aldolase